MMREQRRLQALPPHVTFVTALIAGMNCGQQNRAELLADFGSGCGQNLECSTGARTHGTSQCMKSCLCVTPLRG